MIAGGKARTAGEWESVSFEDTGIMAVRIAAFGCRACSPLKNISCSSNVGERILLVGDSHGTSAVLELLSFHCFGWEKFISAIGAG